MLPDVPTYRLNNYMHYHISQEYRETVCLWQ